MTEVFNNPFAERILIEEITYQSMMADGHFDTFTHYIQSSKERQNRLVWAHLQSFLMHCGMVSKFAKPPRGNEFSTQRGQAVCDLFELADESPIFDRSARNNLEHFDERLDDWLQTTSQAILEIVLPTEAGFEYIKDGKFIRRVFIIETMTYVSQGREDQIERTDLQALHDEIIRIRDLGLVLLG